MQMFGGAVSIPVAPFKVNGGYMGSELVLQGSGRATLFASSDKFSIIRLATITRYRHTTDRQTQHRAIS